MTNATELQAGRETDKLVAEALDWWNLRDAGGYLVGWPPPHRGDGDGEYDRVPHYSTTDAALVALEEFRTSQKADINIMLVEEKDPEPWSIYATHPGVMVIAPTLYLAICRLICGVMGPNG